MEVEKDGSEAVCVWELVLYQSPRSMFQNQMVCMGVWEDASQGCQPMRGTDEPFLLPSI